MLCVPNIVATEYVYFEYFYLYLYAMDQPQLLLTCAVSNKGRKCQINLFYSYATAILPLKWHHSRNDVALFSVSVTINAYAPCFKTYCIPKKMKGRQQNINALNTKCTRANSALT